MTPKHKPDLTEDLKQLIGIEGLPTASFLAIGYIGSDGQERLAIAFEGHSLSLRGLVESAYWSINARVLRHLSSLEEDEE